MLSRTPYSALGCVRWPSASSTRPATVGTTGQGRGSARLQHLGIPCFRLDERRSLDTYAIPRTLRALIAATPVGVAPERKVASRRVTLAETILKTELLAKPAWASI